MHNECNKNNYRNEYKKKTLICQMSMKFIIHCRKSMRICLKIRDINIHDVEYLRGVPKSIHTMITNMWRGWDKALDHSPSKEEVLEFANTVDKLFSVFWYKE